MKLLVVITNYRTTTLTIDCLHSIAREIERYPEVNVAVCENGTGTDDAICLQKAIEENSWSSWCRLTVANVNLGFTGGNNVLIRPALEAPIPPDYVLLLNSDTIVLPNAFRNLIHFMDRNPEVGIAGSWQQSLDGRPLCSAFRFPSPLSEFESAVKLRVVSALLQRSIVALPISETPCEADWLSGASMIVRREVFNDIGVLDEGYFTFFEDVDFCYNAKKAGWPVWFVPDSRIIHLVGQSTGLTVQRPKRQPAYAFQARRRYFIKNCGPLGAALADAARILGLAFWRIRVLFGKEDPTPPHFLIDSLKHSVFLTGFALEPVENPAMQSGL